MFLSRVNEIRSGGGCRLVFGLAKNFEFFDNDTCDCKVLWNLGEGELNSVGF